MILGRKKLKGDDDNMVDVIMAQGDNLTIAANPKVRGC